MAKLIAPLMSLRAKGNLGGTLNFGNINGFTYVRKVKPKIAPYDPKTEIQVHNRYYFKNIVLIWQNLEQQEKDFLDLYGAKKHMSGFNYFTKGYIAQHPSEMGTTIMGVSELGELIF